jgi:hypothetical protein
MVLTRIDCYIDFLPAEGRKSVENAKNGKYLCRKRAKICVKSQCIRFVQCAEPQRVNFNRTSWVPSKPGLLDQCNRTLHFNMKAVTHGVIAFFVPEILT